MTGKEMAGIAMTGIAMTGIAMKDPRNPGNSRRQETRVPGIRNPDPQDLPKEDHSSNVHPKTTGLPVANPRSPENNPCK